MIFLELLSQRRYLQKAIHIVPPVPKSLNSSAVGQVLKRKGVKKETKFPILSVVMILPGVKYKAIFILRDATIKVYMR